MTFLERLWAYVSLGAMGFVWEEASPLIGGVAAFDRRLELFPVIVAVALGTWIVGLLLYALGRWQGKRLRKRWPKLRPLVIQAAAIVRRHPWRTTLAVRFAFGLRVPLPIACGVARVPIWLFVIGSGISCLAWSTIFTVLGWWLGRQAEKVLGQLQTLEPYIGAGFVLLMIVAFVISRRRKVVEKTVKVLDRERKPPADSASRG